MADRNSSNAFNKLTSRDANESNFSASGNSSERNNLRTPCSKIAMLIWLRLSCPKSMPKLVFFLYIKSANSVMLCKTISSRACAMYHARQREDPCASAIPQRRCPHRGMSAMAGMCSTASSPYLGSPARHTAPREVGRPSCGSFTIWRSPMYEASASLATQTATPLAYWRRPWS